MLLGVAGMVGSGKTTLSQALAARFGLHVALEPTDEDNPWLERFYDGPAGMRAFALHLQLHFLAARFAAMRRMIGLGGSWILDRTWYEDAEVFASGLFEQGFMSSDDWQLYQHLYGELLHAPAAHPPRLLLYLHGPLEFIVGRIMTRGRPKERSTDPAYWRDLHARYERWIREFRHCPVLQIDVREYDLTATPDAIEHVAARVRALLGNDLPQTELWPGLGSAAPAVRA